SGHRFGYGVGFYDLLLFDVCLPVVAIAVVYDFQLFADLPQWPHDVACGVVLTDARVLRAAGARS
ncbi:MAG TPA: 5-formyltetrahydrofolate cyclo-ligase, partial [Polyangiaceae bacterium]|nr:5-formyltetrahydrofolate cyclo-ligase [Polyangiaceae bacterium]